MHTILLFLILTHHLLFCKLNKKPFAIKILSLFFACCSLLICSVLFLESSCAAAYADVDATPQICLSAALNRRHAETIGHPLFNSPFFVLPFIISASTTTATSANITLPNRIFLHPILKKREVAIRH